MEATTALDLAALATIRSTYGKDGDLLLKFHANVPDHVIDSLQTEEPVFIVFDEIPVPFYFSALTFKGGNKAIVRFLHFDSPACAEDLVGRTLLVPAVATGLKAPRSRTAFLEGLPLHPEWLEGFRFEAVTADPVAGARTRGPSTVSYSGRVTAAHPIPGNPCIELTLDASGQAPGTTPNEPLTKMVPCHIDFITALDLKAKVVHLQLPPGL